MVYLKIPPTKSGEPKKVKKNKRTKIIKPLGETRPLPPGSFLELGAPSSEARLCQLCSLRSGRVTSACRFSPYISVPHCETLARSRFQPFAPEAHEDNCGGGPQSGVLHSRSCDRPGGRRRHSIAARPLWSVRGIRGSPFQDCYDHPQERVGGIDCFPLRYLLHATLGAVHNPAI